MKKSLTFLIVLIIIPFGLFVAQNRLRISNALKRRLYVFQKERILLPSEVALATTSPSPTTWQATKTPVSATPYLPSPSPSLKSEVYLEAPFISQAPLKHWDAYHEELCEEAAILIVAGSKGKIAPQSKKEMEEELSEIVNFEKGLFNGRWQSTNAEEIARVLQEKFDIKAEVVENFSILDLKQKLSEGHLIIAPTYGRALGNPFYTPPGPIYHALVLKGYRGNQFITHDPGTNQTGENYLYDERVLFKAIHDWPGKSEDVPRSPRRVIVIY